ncbi:MAG: hypothetical protein R3E95_11980 [Thiolinea sp.]
MRPVRVALLDGPWQAGCEVGEGASPAARHAQAVAAALLAECPDVEIMNFPVFAERLVTSRAQVATQVRAALAAAPDLLHCSFGFTAADAETAAAFAQAVQVCRFVVASAPARGCPVWPGAYPGVIRASGDARCQPGEYAWLDTVLVDVAACAQPAQGVIAGSSVAAGRVSGLIARYCLQQGMAWEAFLQQARFRGAERR